MTQHHDPTAPEPEAFHEIARVLETHDGVREAVVCQRDTGEDAHVIAYVVPKGIGPTAGQLRTYLERRLPSRTTPALFVSLDAIPRTPGGAVDHAALPPPNPAWAAFEQRYVAPRTAIEAALAEIWTDVLLLDRIGIHDDFLEQGGDSLLGAQVVSRTYERFGLQIPLEALFERGTIAEIADDFFAGVSDTSSTPIERGASR